MPGYIPSVITMLQLLSQIDLKKSCYVTTTGNIVLSGTQTIDSVFVPAGVRVLVKDQTNATQNGIYVSSSGVWSRSYDANVDEEVVSGMLVYVQAGDLQQETTWFLATVDPIILGSTALSFHQFLGGSGSVLPGKGLTLVGSLLDVVADVDGSIISNDDSIKVGVLATDAQHGNRGNGALHSIATALNNGFLSKEDFSKLLLLDSKLTAKNSTMTYLGNGDIDTITLTGPRTEVTQFFYTGGELSSFETTIGTKKSITVLNYTGLLLTSVTTTIVDI